MLSGESNTGDFKTFCVCTQSEMALGSLSLHTDLLQINQVVWELINWTVLTISSCVISATWTLVGKIKFWSQD